MKALNLTQIKNLVHGAVKTEEGDGKISFFRFTKEQQELYKSVCDDFYKKSFSTSGISLEFETDSESLGLSVSVSPASSRTYFTHSLYINDERVDELSGNIGDSENVTFKKFFNIGSGLKKVTILFPWSVASSLISLELDDRASVFSVEKTRRILMIGDSITQGYDASSPEKAYSVQIARRANVEAVNKGIAGEQFFGRFAALRDNFEPDLITVAYGTNDWRHGTKTRFTRECKAFFENLRQSYPDKPIVAITPLWRVDIDNAQEIGEPLSFITEYIKEVAKAVPDMIVIDGIDLIPHDAKLYQTDGVHPLDAGFENYSKNLWAELERLQLV